MTDEERALENLQTVRMIMRVGKTKVLGEGAVLALMSMAREHEREECAKAIEPKTPVSQWFFGDKVLSDAAHDIRARGGKT